MKRVRLWRIRNDKDGMQTGTVPVVPVKGQIKGRIIYKTGNTETGVLGTNTNFTN